MERSKMNLLDLFQEPNISKTDEVQVAKESWRNEELESGENNF